MNSALEYLSIFVGILFLMILSGITWYIVGYDKGCEHKREDKK